MRRAFHVMACVVAVVVMLASASAALAQAPAPKVTINGFIDEVGAWNRNQGLDATDRARGSLVNPGEDEFYGRTRGRFDIVGEVGKAKGILGLELDLIYGQSGISDACNAPFQGTGSGCRVAVNGGFDADNDLLNQLELKWMYVEVPLTGPGSLLSFIPLEGVVRLGGQPYALGLKPSILADSDFGGAQFEFRFSPVAKLSITYAQFEESSVGSQGALAGTGFGRGEDWGTIAKFDFAPLKGLRVSPIYTFQEIAGTTAALLRRGTGGYGVAAANFNPDVTAAGALAATGGFTGVLTNCNAAIAPCRQAQERRHTLGVDARLDAGPFYVWPTVFWQTGERERYPGATDPGVRNKLTTADIDAWIVDLQSGYLIGPLLLEARALYTTGNKARDNLNSGINYYQPFQTGNSYWATWGEAHTIGSVDYLTALNGFSNSLSETGNIGYDRYGRAQITGKVTYALTPALSAWGTVTPMWTAERVVTNQVITANGLALPTGAGTTRPCDATCRGGSQFLGTDLSAGLTYSFAPGLRFDAAYGILFPGNAYSVTVDNGVRAGGAASGTFTRLGAENTQVAAARVRFTF